MLNVLMDMDGSSVAWIGGRIRHDLQTFEWTDGSPFGNFTLWSQGFPLLYKDAAICASYDGTWSVDRQDATRSYVCEYMCD